jgi:hypothetical protein
MGRNVSIRVLNFPFCDFSILSGITIFLAPGRWKSLNSDMTSFNAWMHNKVVLFVPDLSLHQAKLIEDDVSYMKRLSTLADGTIIAHLSISVQGRIYEITGPASSADTTGFTFWDGSLGECPAAHDLSFYTSFQGWVDAYDYQISISSIGAYGSNGLPVPMIAYVTSTSDAPQDQPDLLHLKSFTGAAFEHSVHSYVKDTENSAGSSYAQCETLDVTWDTTLNNSEYSQRRRIPLIAHLPKKTTSTDITFTNLSGAISLRKE